MRILPTLLAAALGGGADEAPLPDLLVERDDVVVTASCRLVVPDGLVIEDANGDGVVHVRADGVRVVFAPGSVLRGTAPGTAPDACTGTGIRIDGRRDVLVEDARLLGFAVGLHASAAHGLRVRGAQVEDGRRQRLRSTPQAADDGADWLAPHDNDAHEWRTRYGAALCVEDSTDVEISGCRARGVQNGLILDRVREARVFDSDFSFLSGWGIAAWRLERSVIDHVALDACVRGYSHGVYNRGQDSAGLLLFEQCVDNVVAWCSITHGGDGIFAFAGREALGERGESGERASSEGLDLTGRGNARNVFVGNDLSFAAAHGLELTFSFDNVIVDNVFEGNAICGIWGGYSQRTTIVGNAFARNGDAGYGLERGGVNVEHGADNAIVGNTFAGDACGIHLWWDEDAHLATLPWARANGVAARDTLIAANAFDAQVGLALHLRDAERTMLDEGAFEPAQVRREGGSLAPVDAALVRAAHERAQAARERARAASRGTRQVVGARPHLRGREHIVMSAWGPVEPVAPAPAAPPRR